MPKTAFLFPGQGSQSVGMLSDLAQAFPRVEAIFAEASAVLGHDLWTTCQQDPENLLDRTDVTQPAMLAAGWATWCVWRDAGGKLPDFLAGHSLGEYTALVGAGAIGFAEAVRVVAERGRLMQAAVPEGLGAMAAVLGMEDEALMKLCESEAGDQVVSCANFNAPGQVVVAGHREAVERVCSAARKAGAKRVVVLPVSVPSHCALMEDAAQRLAAVLAQTELHPPTLPIVHNADVAVVDQPDAIRDALARQLWQPVQWTRTIRLLLDQGVTRFVECGPGKVLAGLNRRIAGASAVTHALTDRAAVEAALQTEET